MKSRGGLIKIALTMAVALANVLPAATQNGNAARVVVWQMKPGRDRDFQEGYKRHLQWHRDNHDTWTWRGWILGSGDRVDYFVDGTFFHSWSDFDNPASPASDAANNAINVEPYADVRALATYEAIPALSNLRPEQLGSPMLTFFYLQATPGKEAELEAALGRELARSDAASVMRAVLRPVNGATEYLLLLPYAKASELGSQGEFVSRLLQGLAKEAGASSLIVSYRTETAHYHPELSNVP
jgi:hypothetical protein